MFWIKVRLSFDEIRQMWCVISFGNFYGEIYVEKELISRSQHMCGQEWWMWWVNQVNFGKKRII